MTDSNNPTGAAADPLPKPPVSLVDPQATPATRALMARLIEGYGQKVLSGQYLIEECQHIAQQTGRTPAILGVDLMDYSPSRVHRGANPVGSVEQWVEAGRSGQIITVSWHWNAPKDLIDAVIRDEHGKEVDALWYRGFYTVATTFDVEKALANPASKDYQLILRDMDVIAQEMRKFADADIPVLWRPLHEADGKWFWWGAKGPKPLVALWRLMYERFTKHHQLHNLIWVFTGTGNDWYPGDDYVDILGVDAYPQDRHDPLKAIWETLQTQFAGKKLVALTEFGGIPDIMAMWRVGVRWSYFTSWVGTKDSVTPEWMNQVYNDNTVANAAP